MPAFPLLIPLRTEYRLNFQYLTTDRRTKRGKLDGGLRADVNWKVQKTTRGAIVSHGSIRGSRERVDS